MERKIAAVTPPGGERPTREEGSHRQETGRTEQSTRTDLSEWPSSDPSCHPRRVPSIDSRPEVVGDGPAPVGRVEPEETRHRGDAGVRPGIPDASHQRNTKDSACEENGMR